MKSITVLGLLFSLTSLAEFLPKEEIEALELNPQMVGEGLTEKEFHSLIKDVEKLYRKEIESHSVKFEIVIDWPRDTPNAFAAKTEKKWKITFYGGLARLNGMKRDHYAVVVCHEVGHLIGGAPTKPHNPNLVTGEGQADYWAASKCLKRLFEKDDNLKWVSENKVHPHAEELCENVYADPKDKAICLRTASASVGFARMLEQFRKPKKKSELDTPDPNEVKETNHFHPMPQCRLDTVFQGGLCHYDGHPRVDQKKLRKNTCVREKNFTLGVRPLCWFKPEK